MTIMEFIKAALKSLFIVLAILFLLGFLNTLRIVISDNLGDLIFGSASVTGFYCRESKGLDLLLVNENGSYKSIFIKDNDTLVNEGKWEDGEYNVSFSGWKIFDPDMVDYGCFGCNRSAIKKRNRLVFYIDADGDSYNKCNSSNYIFLLLNTNDSYKECVSLQAEEKTGS